jgi:hypothetical protein
MCYFSFKKECGSEKSRLISGSVCSTRHQKNLSWKNGEPYIRHVILLGSISWSLLKLKNLLKNKNSWLIQSASPLKFHFLFLAEKERTEYKSKAFSITSLHNLVLVCNHALHKEDFFMLSRNLRWSGSLKEAFRELPLTQSGTLSHTDWKETQQVELPRLRHRCYTSWIGASFCRATSIFGIDRFLCCLCIHY